MRKLFLASLIALSTIGITKSYQVIDFSEYKNLLTTQNIQDWSQIEKAFSQIQNSKCKYKEKGNDFIISPICLRKKEYPELEFKEAVDLIRPHVQWFSNEYDDKNPSFEFSGASLKIDYGALSLAHEYHDTISQKKVISALQYKKIYIKIPKVYFARYTVQKFNYFPAKKETKNMWSCTKTNYLVSSQVIDWLYLKSWESFNINKAISRIPWYCKGINWNKNLPFYGGSCGSAGQLFRTTLITPNLTTTKRYPHLRRRAQYYGPTIYWDDAAILDNQKQFEIRNDGSMTVYFKKLEFEDYSYLVAITPIQQALTTQIHKQNTWPLTTLLNKTVVDTSRQIQKTEQFPSRYMQYFAWWV